MLSSNTYFLVLISWNIFVSQFEIDKVSAAAMDEVQAMQHLAQYGYLDVSAKEIQSGKRASKEIMSKALREYQEFHNLEVTGNLDKLTIDKMEQPRCGAQDKFPKHSRSKRYTYNGRKWRRSKISYFLKYNSRYLPAHIGPREVRRAFKLWEKYIPLEIEESSDYNTADILVYFGTGVHGAECLPFDGPGGLVAHARAPSLEGERQSFIHFDDDEDWHFVDENDPNFGRRIGYNLYQVAVHEVGHTLGLSHSSNPESVMRPTNGEQYEPNFRLHQDDINGIQRLYYNNKIYRRKWWYF